MQESHHLVLAARRDRERRRKRGRCYTACAGEQEPPPIEVPNEEIRTACTTSVLIQKLASIVFHLFSLKV
jgi:hypothetical protein